MRRLIGAIIVLSLVALLSGASTAFAEKSVQDWWENDAFPGTSFPGAPAPGADHQMFKNHISGYYEICLEEAGWGNYNSFGMYSYDSTGAIQMTQIFDATSGVGATVQFTTPADEFGFYYDVKDGNTYYTEDNKNADGYAHAWVFDIPAPYTANRGYVFAWEDLPDGGDKDHNDLVVTLQVNETPGVPTALLMGVSGIAVPWGLRLRRKKK